MLDQIMAFALGVMFAVVLIGSKPAGEVEVWLLGLAIIPVIAWIWKVELESRDAEREEKEANRPYDWKRDR